MGRPKNDALGQAEREEYGCQTWAGAFMALARRLHETGDEEGWELARRIAERKGVRL